MCKTIGVSVYIENGTRWTRAEELHKILNSMGTKALKAYLNSFKTKWVKLYACLYIKISLNLPTL